jgi:hypothetical protein
MIAHSGEFSRIHGAAESRFPYPYNLVSLFMTFSRHSIQRHSLIPRTTPE